MAYSANDKAYRINVVIFCMAVLVTICAYWGGLQELIVRWNKQEEYGHGYFIPLLTAWFLWNRKEALLASKAKGEWSGVVVVIFATFMLMIGEVTALFSAIQLGFIFALMGLVLAYGGRALLMLTLAPIFFLVFCIPLPYFLEALLTAKLQLISSELGVSFLRLFGTSVYLEGNIIDLGQYRLQVIEACSGLRYLYPLMGIGFLIAYMYQEVAWKRIVLFASTIPITVFMNSARIAMVGLLVEQWGNGMADGFLHYFEGWIVFMLCLIVLLAEVWVFEFFAQKRKLAIAIDLPQIQVIESANKQIGLNPIGIVALVVILGSLVLVVINNDRQEIKPERKSLISYPLSFSSWNGHESSLSKPELELLGLTDYILADYSQDGKQHINYYIAYYASQRKGVSPHSPQVCMPGGGWQITSIEPIMLDDGFGKPFKANRVIIQKNDQRQLVYYWFEQRGRRISSEYWMKWYLFKDALMMNRTDGALVRLVAPSPVSEPIEKADERLQSFLKVSMPILNEYVPK